MASFHEEDNNPDRFCNPNLILETMREVFDVSTIPVGHVERPSTPLVPPLSPEDKNFLRRTLFPENSIGQDTEYPNPPTETTVVTATNTTTIAAAAGIQEQEQQDPSVPSQQPRAPETTTTVPPPPPAAPPRQSSSGKTNRNRFSYSKQYFYANSDIYLQINPAFPLPEDNFTPELVGYVHSCPTTKKNGDVYTIKWTSLRIDGEKWPSNLVPHLKTQFDKATLHKRLKELILACPLNNKPPAPAAGVPPPCPQPAVLAPPALQTPIVPTRLAPSQESRIPIIDMTIIETPAASSQRSAFAALHTAGSASAYTAISSLGHLNRSTVAAPAGSATAPASRRQRRRPHTDITGGGESSTALTMEYDTDEDDTDNEAGYELNAANGLWNIQTQMNELDINKDDTRSSSDVSDTTPIGNASITPALPDFGNLIANCTNFHFKEINTETPEEAAEWMRLHPLPKLYDGESGLKRGVAGTFNTPLEALRQAGMTKELIARYTKNSNRYYHSVIKHRHVSATSRTWQGILWKDITEDEMHRFFGCLLRCSLQPIDNGGYPAYFRENNINVNLYEGSSVEIPGTMGFMATILDKCKMSLNRFKQIRGAFHPEDKVQGNGDEDKCYQIRAALNELNAAAAATFVPERNLAFDEGGMGCRSRYCPVRMYNKDKPDKFRVDFFILAGSQSYVIHHMDVYQGKNASNVSIDERCWNLPTTMKAVVNAVIKCKLQYGSNDANGYRVISLDNRYQCPVLAYLLWTRFNILLTGTCRTNRKGWPKNLMKMEKKVQRGTFKIAICEEANLLAIQWRDSRVVNHLSSYMDLGVGNVRRRKGATRMFVQCPSALMYYQQNMGGVDRADQMRMHFGGFAGQGHFKKWYKKILMGPTKHRN